MLSFSSSFRLATVVAAVALAVAPLPRPQVERWYSHGLYPRLQAVVTPATNALPLAFADIAAGLLLALVLWRIVILVARKDRGRAALRGVRAAVVGGAALYLLFLAMWGLNYQRVPLETVLDYDEARVTRAAAVALASEATRQANAGWAASRVRPLDEGALGDAFARQQRALGAQHVAARGRPKASLLGLYFRQAAIDGMINPFFLEIILNPDLLPFERPMVLAHEWTHLAGYAHEAEANFVAWLACLDADPIARYSAWLAAYEHATRVLPQDDRRRLPPLADGPRADLRAMAERYRRSSPAVRTAARDVYDSYLRAHRVPEGIDSYGTVVRLMLGVQREAHGLPLQRSR